MRESEMRQRVEDFFKRRMQGMLVPALGLGLAVAGCEKTTATPVYSAPNPDAPIGHVGDAGDVPVYSAPIAPDAYLADALVGKDTLPPGTDSEPDHVRDTNVPSDVSALADVWQADLALVPDAGKDAVSEAGAGVDAIPGVDGADAGAGVDSGADFGNMTTKYMAQLPDAGRDLGVAPVYMASLPLG
jgi:hypothetical protein